MSVALSLKIERIKEPHEDCHSYGSFPKVAREAALKRALEVATRIGSSDMFKGMCWEPHAKRNNVIMRAAYGARAVRWIGEFWRCGWVKFSLLENRGPREKTT